MKAYNTPTLVDYGNVSSLTGIFGSSAVQDNSYGPTGTVINQQTGSIDQCATSNQSLCL